MKIRIGKKQRESLRIIADGCGPVGSNLKCYLSGAHFGWIRFDTQSELNRHLKAMEDRGLIVLSGAYNCFAEITQKGRDTLGEQV